MKNPDDIMVCCVLVKWEMSESLYISDLDFNDIKVPAIMSVYHLMTPEMRNLQSYNCLELNEVC